MNACDKTENHFHDFLSKNLKLDEVNISEMFINVCNLTDNQSNSVNNDKPVEPVKLVEVK